MTSDSTTVALGPRRYWQPKCSRSGMLRLCHPGRCLWLPMLLFAAAGAALAAESDALAISIAIQAGHLPFGTILDPVYASPDSNDIASYRRCRDSAPPTGHYLAAAAFPYQMT